jgi:inner membrane protein
MTDTPNPPPNRPPNPPIGQFASIMPRRSTGLKLLLVCALALVLAIPALFVYGTVLERSQDAQQAFNEIAAKAGGEQSMLGPVLGLPYSYAPDAKKPEKIVYGVGLIYPETGQVETNVDVAERSRGIHLIPVYTAKTSFSAAFRPENFSRALPRNATPLWADARIYMGVSDARGLKTAIELTINGQAATPEPASYSGQYTESYDPVPATHLALVGAEVRNLETLTRDFTVTAEMTVSGAGRLAFGPFAKDTELTMTSNWPSPSFTGGTLPDTHNSGESENGFTASWRVPYLARGIPGAGPRLSLSDVTAFDQRDLAVRFVRDANPYQSVQRALKYAAMFVGFVFLSYFLFEVTSGLRAHPAQYVLVGLAQTIFYLLLLALSEKIGFDLAFAIAASMTILLTSAYAMSVFRSRTYGLRALAILTAIYSLIFMLMRAQSNALLAGAFASFAAIACTMYMTRNVDWYGDRQTETN